MQNHVYIPNAGISSSAGQPAAAGTTGIFAVGANTNGVIILSAFMSVQSTVAVAGRGRLRVGAGGVCIVLSAAAALGVIQSVSAVLPCPIYLSAGMSLEFVNDFATQAYYEVTYRTL
jgi:hypothetical protein